MKIRSLSISIAMITLLCAQGYASKKDNKISSPSALSSLSGVVTDKKSNEKLAGVLIQFNSTDQKIYSDAKGEFKLEGIEPGTYKVKINCISYKEKEVSVRITKTPNEKLKIQLYPVEP